MVPCLQFVGNSSIHPPSAASSPIRTSAGESADMVEVSLDDPCIGKQASEQK
jgi:hypothetical protein